MDKQVYGPLIILELFHGGIDLKLHPSLEKILTEDELKGIDNLMMAACDVIEKGIKRYTTEQLRTKK